jgi:hypothetical protein
MPTDAAPGSARKPFSSRVTTLARRARVDVHTLSSDTSIAVRVQ